MPNGFASLTSQVLTSAPALTPVKMDIGTADCGWPAATAGLVSEITVPAGYYDIFSTFVFYKP